jgi:hypothetical protein
MCRVVIKGKSLSFGKLAPLVRQKALKKACSLKIPKIPSAHIVLKSAFTWAF